MSSSSRFSLADYINTARQSSMPPSGTQSSPPLPNRGSVQPPASDSRALSGQPSSFPPATPTQPVSVPQRTIPQQNRQINTSAETISPEVQAAVAAGAKLTKSGKIDRRFKGFRDRAPEPDVPRTSGGLIGPDGTRLTKEGKPDVRYIENRGKSKEQVMREWAQNVLAVTEGHTEPANANVINQQTK